MLLVLRSDPRYTEGLNIRYLGSIQRLQLANFVTKLHKAGMQYSGQVLYKSIKRYMPQALGLGMGYFGTRKGRRVRPVDLILKGKPVVPRMNPQYNSYRKYITAYLKGVEVNVGVNKANNRVFEMYLNARDKILSNSYLKKKSQTDMALINFLGRLPRRQELATVMKETATRFTHLFNQPSVTDQQQDSFSDGTPPGTEGGEGGGGTEGGV